MDKVKCIFCGDDAEFVYMHDEYELYSCKGCRTSFVNNMPTQEQLAVYYDGFNTNYSLKLQTKMRIVSKAFQDFYKTLNFPANAKMLDIGGGGGFFSLAFEKYGFGVATYVDLDNVACEYAKNLGLKNVIYGDVCDESTLPQDEKFDFIYCRHVIEHIPNPLPIINKAIDLLKPNGLFILQFPNGLSLENLAPRRWREKYINKFLSSNNVTRGQAIKMLYSIKVGNDIDPPRHLWGISKKGISTFLRKRDDIEFSIETASIRDKIWSPHYVNTNDYTRLSLFLHRLPYGGNHMICKIRKK